MICSLIVLSVIINIAYLVDTLTRYAVEIVGFEQAVYDCQPDDFDRQGDFEAQAIVKPGFAAGVCF